MSRLGQRAYGAGRPTLAAMVARCVRYEIEGWGVGSCGWATGHARARVAFACGRQTEAPLGGRGPPRTKAAERRPMGADFVPDLMRRVRLHLAGDRTDYGDVPLDLSWCTPFQARPRAGARGAVGRGRQLRRAVGARRATARGPGRPGRSVRRQPRRALPALPSSPPAGSAATAQASVEAKLLTLEGIALDATLGRP